MKKSLSTTVSVYNAGGGPGRRNIEFDTLAEGQSRMYERTLNQLSDFQIEFLAQEKRQITVVDIPVTINVNIAREDFPDITARIEITFVPSASQQAWEKFIKDTCKRLKVDFIYCILDRVDRSPVHRILRLRDNGDYLARQRETSAILEVINTGRTPMEVSWDITMDINDVKQSLALDERNQPVIDRRIASLVSKPVTRETQRDISTLLLNAVSPKVAVGIMEQFHRQYKLSVAGAGGEEDQPTAGGNWTGTGTEPSDVNWGDTARYGDAIDIVSLHRLCLETLARFAIKGRAKNIAASPCFDYVCGVIDGLRHEVDVVAMGLKLLSDVMKYLVEERERTYHVILDCVQAYAPPAPKHRPRNPKRLRAAEDLYGESMAGLGLSGGGTGGGFSIGAVGSPAGAVGAGVGRPPGGNMNMGGSGAAGAYGQSVSNQQQQSVEQGGGKGTAPATGAADIHPSLKRYGDFYGHSPAPQPGAVLEFSQSINLTKLYEHKNTDAHNRWQSREHASPRKEAVVPVSTTVVDTPKTPEVGPRGPPDPDSVKALVRGRVRVDHQAATNALQSAFHPTAAASGGGAHASSSSVGSALVTAPSGSAGASTVAASTKEKVPAQDSAEFLQQQKEFREKKKRVPKYQFKFKLKGAKEEGGGFSSDGGGDTGDETEKKSQWKGTVGVIGR